MTGPQETEKDVLPPSRLLVIRLVVENEPDVLAVGFAPEWVERPYVGEFVILPGVNLWMPIVGVYIGKKMTQFFSDGLLETLEQRDKLVEALKVLGFKHGEDGSSLLESSEEDEGSEHTGFYL